ncbi:GPP34 family phosphoprotein [Streptomyces caniferus]|uniref:GOLPH3/VPS74 family protein n=1 Tax=Streptomyces caniferus TaxID=285557 RepID=UPI002E28A641|nr:GPP34 family phosphoprotein [Streptomyces caniferus]
MTTPRDLLLVAMDTAPVRTVERGDLSLVLAGAEAIDLLEGRAVTLRGDRLVPGYRPAIADRLLDEAASSLVMEEPYESVGDWLWRRGRGLSEAYLAAFEEEGQLIRQRRRRWLFFRTSEMVLVDSPERREVAHRWAADEPALAALAEAAGIRDRRTEDPAAPDGAVSAVLIAVDEALAELAVERQRRARRRDQAAVDNVRRGY